MNRAEVFARVLRAAILTVLATALVLVLVQSVGDPAATALGPRATPEQIEAFRHANGLDRPFIVQLVGHLWHMVQGDFGVSLRTHEPVLDVVLSRFPRTLLLVGLALSLEVLFGAVLGVVAALRKGRPADVSILIGTSLLVSVPTFMTGLLALQFLAFRWHLFPLGGLGYGAVDMLRHAALPSMILASASVPTYTRMIRSEMIESLSRPYMTAARARGLSARVAVLRHAMRHAAIPIVAMIGQSAPLLITGAVITESVFQWPGMGRLAIESITSLDLPVLLSIVTLSALAVQLGNLAADLALMRLDPRIKSE